MYRLVNKIIVGITIACLAGFALGQVESQLNASSTNHGMKIAVVDFNKVILKSNYAQRELEAFKNDDEYKKLSVRRAELQSLVQELANIAVAKQTEEQQVEVETARNEYALMSAEMKSKYQRLLQQIGKAMQERAQKVVSDLVEAEGIDLLLDIRAVSFVKPRYDITDKLIVKINDENP